jgi:predicted ribosomally synthesized peptide with nif11-like leader
MSATAAGEFLDRLEEDEAFASELEAVKSQPDVVIGKVHAAGYDATPDEILNAFSERYGFELTPEQLDQIAAGADPGLIAGATIGAVAGAALVVAICAGI